MSRMEERYVAVRKTDGKEWFDVESTIAILADDSAKKAEEIDLLIPWWSKDNPVMRIAKVYISEDHPYFKQ